MFHPYHRFSPLFVYVLLRYKTADRPKTVLFGCIHNIVPSLSGFPNRQMIPHTRIARFSPCPLMPCRVHIDCRCRGVGTRHFYFRWQGVICHQKNIMHIRISSVQLIWTNWEAPSQCRQSFSTGTGYFRSTDDEYLTEHPCRNSWIVEILYSSL